MSSVAHFLESRGMIEDALEVATDPDYRFELAIQLGRLEIAKVTDLNLCKYLELVFIVQKEHCPVTFQLREIFFIFLVVSKILMLHISYKFILHQEIATVSQSETKWKQLGELAMSAGMVFILH